MQTQCPECKTVVNAPKEYLGKKARCKNCQHRFTVEEYTPPKPDPPKEHLPTLPAQAGIFKKDDMLKPEPTFIDHARLLGGWLVLFGLLGLIVSLWLGLQYANAMEGFRDLAIILTIVGSMLSLLVMGIGVTINYLFMHYRAYIIVNFPDSVR